MVVLVNETTPSPGARVRRVVVGVDGSRTGQHALAVAAEEARLRDASLDVVYAWHTPYVVSPIGTIVLPLDEREQEADAANVLELSLRDAFAPGAEAPAPVERILVKDNNAARALLDVARGADLLVVGSRGLGGFAGLLLGSVSGGSRLSGV